MAVGTGPVKAEIPQGIRVTWGNDPFNSIPYGCCGRPKDCQLKCSWKEYYANATGPVTEGSVLDIKPSYYNSGSNDLIAFALAHGIGAMEFTVMKYVMRWKGKDGLKDLRKAREYLDRLIVHEDARLAGELASEAEDVASKGDT